MSPGDPDPAILEQLEWFQLVSSILAGLIAGASLIAAVFPAFSRSLPSAWLHMTAESAICILLCIVILQCISARFSLCNHRVALLLAAVVALLSTATLLEYAVHATRGIEVLFPPYYASIIQRRMPPQAAGCFVLLALTLIFLRARKGLVSHIADSLACLVGLLVLIIASGYIFGAARIFGISARTEVSPQSLICLSLLTLTTMLRRAENGTFSILLGRGIGSRIVRILFPIMLVFPLLREMLRAHMLAASRLPPHYTTAILVSIATLIGEFLLFFLAWRIRSMEMEIHDLSLRDALTGLYNLRGFYLLADQALRLAHRSDEPFTVLFVDLDNLKRINDSLGHDFGSQFLVNTAQILNETFRETDVLGRVGGDEFAVAGQFDPSAIMQAEERLTSAAAQRNAGSGGGPALSFSIGHATSSKALQDTLDQLLTRADQAMYRQKRAKKSGMA